MTQKHFCVECKEWLEFIASDFEIVDDDGKTFRKGEVFRCPKCHRIVIVNVGEPYKHEG